MDVQFFGDVDRDARGNITSSYPAWYQENLVRNVNEEIENLEINIRRMEEGRVAMNHLPTTKQRLRKLKERRDEILSTKPKLSGKAKDELNKKRLELGKEIGESMFSHSDMHRGTADPHRELERQKGDCVKLDGELAHNLGIKLGTDGKVGRDVAIRAFKIVSRAIGADPNPERLRMQYQREF